MLGMQARARHAGGRDGADVTAGQQHRITAACKRTVGPYESTALEAHRAAHVGGVEYKGLVICVGAPAGVVCCPETKQRHSARRRPHAPDIKTETLAGAAQSRAESVQSSRLGPQQHRQRRALRALQQASRRLELGIGEYALPRRAHPARQTAASGRGGRDVCERGGGGPAPIAVCRLRRVPISRGLLHSLGALGSESGA